MEKYLLPYILNNLDGKRFASIFSCSKYKIFSKKNLLELSLPNSNIIARSTNILSISYLVLIHHMVNILNPVFSKLSN